MQEKLTYDEFYALVWEDSSWLEQIVSTAYLEENDEFVRNLTFEMYNIYEKSDIKPRLMVKFFEIWFFNLFRFKGGNENIKELKDEYRYF